MRGDPDVEAVAAQVGLPHGRLITMSKSSYRRSHPGHLVVFNASLFTLDGRHVWRGDIDVTLDERLLVALARRLDRAVALFHERIRIDEFDLDDAVLMVALDGLVTPNPRYPCRRDVTGRLVPVST